MQFFLVFGLLIAAGTHSVSAQSFSEILGRPTDQSITMSILFEERADVYWEYGLLTGNYPDQTSSFVAQKAVPLEVDFTGLQADTRYYYRTRYRLSGSGSYYAGPEHTFHTQRKTGSTFNFTVESDEHLYDKKGVRSIYQVCLKNQAADRPDFMFSLGDTFGDDHQPLTTSSSDMDKLHKDYRPYLGSVCHSIPFFFCLGNHEGEFNYYLAQTPPENIAVYGTLWRKFYYPNPYPNDFYSGNTDVEPYGMGNPENYYSFTWGDALFIVLDVYRYQSVKSAKPSKWDWTLGFPQYTWLKNTLEHSNARYRFVFAHHTLGQGRGGSKTARYYEWGGYNADGITWGFDVNRPGWDKPIHQLFVDNHVNIFFQGHDHLFAREVLDGVVYQEVPMPSDSTYEIGMLANAEAYGADVSGGTGHLNVAVSPDSVTVDFVRAYLPADTLAGIHHNREVGFRYSISSGVSAVGPATGHPEMIRVFPNPASDQLTVFIPDNQGAFNISLFSLSGQALVTTQSSEIDLSGIPDGIYIVNIRTANYQVNKKITRCR
jgi:hypothetical protein